MKIVKRIGVFETNSSSTHSVEILKKDIYDSFREEDDIEDDEREIRTPLNKMLFVFGLIDHHLTFYKHNDEIYEQEKKNIRIFKKTFISKYEEKFGKIDKEIRDKISKNEDHGYDGSFCLDFFNEDTLNDCTCGYDSFTDIVSELGDGDADDYREHADYLFNPNVYFLIKEGWYGGCWYIDKKVF